jgi:hypothetical protein
MHDFSAGDSAPPANPLMQTQAGVFEHKQLHLTAMGPQQFGECVDIVRRHRGTRCTRLGAYVTHVVVGPECHDQEKIRILQFVEEQGGLCHIVHSEWLFACDEVRPCTCHTCTACGLSTIAFHSSAASSDFGHSVAGDDCDARKAAVLRRKPLSSHRVSVELVAAQFGVPVCCLVTLNNRPDNPVIVGVQAQASANEAAFAVDLDAWKEQCGSSLPTSQACCVLAGFSFFLDALNDDKERRLAKEYIRSLGGQVRPDMLRGPYLVACWWCCW